MKFKRQISILLAFVLTLGCFGFSPASAQQAQTDAVTNSSPSPVQTDDLTKDSQILDHVDAEQFQNAGHIARLPGEETLDSYVFLNGDGTKSVYYMGRPVKYVDENGTIREKDTTLVRRNGGYGMRDNDVTLHIPDAAANGITLTYNNCAVKLTPQGGSGVAQQEDNSIVYANYFGRGTFLRYTPMLSGMKEDIILAKYTGQNSFTFLLETGGLRLYETEGSYYLAENEDAEAAFHLGQILVYDAIGRPDLGTMTAETLVPGQRYRLTVSADEAFLTDPKTVYPVTIDPTLTVRDAQSEDHTLEDAPVFSGYPNWHCGDYVYNSMGYVEGMGTAMTAIRLTGLLADSNYSQLTEAQLNNVTFYIRSAGSEYANISVHALTENSTWTEMGITWNNIGAYSETSYASQDMGNVFWAAFDITNLAKDWKNGTQNPQCGFVLVSDSTTRRTATYAAEHGTADNRPYVVVNYNNQLTVTPSGVTMYVGESMPLTAISNPAGQAVSWASDTPTVASVDENGVVTGLSAGTATITATLDAETSATCTVEVREKTISFRHTTDMKVYKGQSDELLVVTEPVGELVDWSSLDTSIATVTQEGVVTGVSPGFATIRAALSDGTYADCEVEVLSTSISFDCSCDDDCADDCTCGCTSVFYIALGENVTLTANTVPSGLPVMWSSSDPTVATVNQSGEVTALNVGDAIVRASISGGGFVECTVIVQCAASFVDSPTKLDEGTSFELQLDIDDQIDITWISSDENIATVSNDGVVTGVRIGKVTITAQSQYLTSALSCTFYVTLEDGVYYFQNLHSQYFLHVPYGTIGDRTSLVQEEQLASEYYGEQEQIRQLWRVRYLNAGEYAIYPMLIPHMSLCVDMQDNVFIEDLYASGMITSVNVVLPWKITRSGAGYTVTSTVFHKGTLQVVNSALTQGATINVAPRMESTSAVWNLIKVDNPPIGAALLDTETGRLIPYSMQIYLALNEEWGLETKNLMAVFYSDLNYTKKFTWTTNCASVVTVDDNGTMKGIGAGESAVYATIDLPGTEIDPKITFYIIVLPIANGTYLIKNRQNKCLVTASGQVYIDGSLEVYQAKHAMDGNGNHSDSVYQYQGWNVYSTGDGFYSIEAKDAVLLYLAVFENREMGNYYVSLTNVADGNNIPMEAQWKIDVIGDNAIRIMSRTDYNLVLKTTTSSAQNGVELGIGSYTADVNYQDEWLLADWGAFMYSKVETTEFSIQLSDELATDQNWYPLIVEAIDIWNNSLPNIHISITTEDSPITMCLKDLSEISEPLDKKYGGVTSPRYMDGRYHAEIALDTNIRNENINYKLHVIVHEIGHLFGLEDEPPVASFFGSIMRYGHNREEMLSPCPYDIANIKFIYDIE